MYTVLNRYDNEYIGFLNEIGKRLIYFNGEEKFKIKTWIKLLSIHYETKEEKQNRNLYAIKLINQMINGKIKYPFNNYANINELKPLLAINIKAELTPQFYKEISIQDVVNFGNQMQEKFLSSHPDYYYHTFNNHRNTIGFNDNKVYLNNNNINHNTINDYNNLNKMNLNTMRQNEAINENDYFNNSININDEEIVTLYYRIYELENKIKECDHIIEYQNNEINKLNNILGTLINQMNLNDNNEENKITTL